MSSLAGESAQRRAGRDTRRRRVHEPPQGHAGLERCLGQSHCSSTQDGGFIALSAQDLSISFLPGLTLKNTGENTVKLCPTLCRVPSAVSGSRHEPWGRRERAEACLCVDTPQSLLVLRQGPVCTVRVLSCEYRTVAPSTACSQHCKQPCIKSSPRFPSDPSWGLVVECSFPRRGPWDKSPSAPACQYLHA